MVEIRQLRYFVIVAEERHFGRAASRLQMAQPPLSQQIKKLETELGTQLLERTTRRVGLTSAGELLLSRSRHLLDEVEQLTQDVREVGSGSVGILRVGFTGSASYRLMPAVLKLMHQEHPRVYMHITGEMLTPALELALTEDRLDVAILRPPINSLDLDIERVKKDSLVVALHPDHPLADSEGPLSIEDLIGRDFVSYPAISAMATLTFELCRTTGFRPQVVYEANETSTLLSLVRANVGLAIVPETARQDTPQPTLTYRPLENAPAVDLSLAWVRGHDSALVAAFRNVVARATRELLAEDLPETTAPEDA